jgi:protein-S-isoprenylcysteine O-methyltransferase Ste14
MFTVRLVLAIVGQVALYGTVFFVPAGTLDWWRAWVVIALMTGLAAWSTLHLPRELIEARLRSPIRSGQPTSDKLFVPLFVVSFLVATIVIPIDVFRLHLLPKPGAIVSSFGMLLFLGGSWISYRALHDNAFAEPAVRHQTERHQTVVDTGLYAWVRHPLYAGGAILLLGLPLWLESYAGALLALLPIGMIAIRIRIEEGLLRRELPGYEEYTRRVRYRLVPHLW